MFNDIILKTGPFEFIRGELHFYQNIPEVFADYFPKLINWNKIENKVQLSVDFINGLPLYYLYKNKLITHKIIDDLFLILEKFHSYKNGPCTISENDVKNNYFEKIKRRFENKMDYCFDNAESVMNDILNGLEENYSAEIVPFIHGDFWFSNILMTYDDNYKFIDMKGQVEGILTTNGDKYYDYGKLLQSIIGYDLYLNNDQIDEEYIGDMKAYYLEKCSLAGLNIQYLRFVTKSLIFGTFHSIDNDKIRSRNNIWKLVMQT